MARTTPMLRAPIPTPGSTLREIMSVPIARLQDWKSLAKFFSLSAACALVVRFFVDVLKPSAPIAAIVGPIAVLMFFAVIFSATGYYRTLARMRRERNALPDTSPPGRGFSLREVE